MKKGHDLKIREKLSKSYMQVIFIASISAIVGIGALLIMTRMYNNALTNYGFSQGDIGKAMTVFAGARSDLRGAVGYDEESIIKELKEDYYVKQDSFNTYLAEVEKSMVTKAGRDAYNQLLADLDGYWELSDELIEIGATTDEAGSKEAQDRAVKELKPMYEAVYNDLKDLMDVNVQKGDQTEAILAVMEIIVVIIIIAVIILSVLSGRRLGNQIADGIAKPLQQMSERLKTFAEGDLDSEFPEHDAKDEVAEMIETARQMADNLNVIISDSGSLLNEMADGNFAIATDHEERYTGKFNDSLHQVEETAEQVSMGSGNMAEAAQSLAEGATEQAGAVEELQATIADITANVEHTAADLQKSHADARKYADDADHSREQMHAMVEAMQRISESSMKIENIISELEDIASQTNLLSLNASIEAARAGEAGKGFAVVADQIRKLAEQSAASAVSTRELIEGSIHDVEEGNKAVALVSETLDEVIKGINDIADTSKSLSENSQSQATAMEQAEQGVNQISEVVQSNSAMAQETSATSEELSAQAETLDNLVRQFKLREQK